MSNVDTSMSTTPAQVAIPPANESISAETIPDTPFLRNGDRLSRAEFERRYLAMPSVKKAELIEGIVYMPSPVRYKHHSQPHAHLTSWACYYVSKTPGLKVGDNGTSRLDEDNEPQPDVLLFVPKHLGGNAYVDEDDYISGSPELLCEVSASTVSIDLHAKKNAYRRNGVLEYLVVRTEDQEIDWFELVDGQYLPKQPDDHGLLRSKVFPGLCLDAPALLAGDLAKLFTAIDSATDSDEHRTFSAKLSEAEGEKNS